MTFRVFDAKWGNPTIGQSGGQVTWASNIDTGLQFNSGAHTTADFDSALASAFQAWEDVASIDFVQTSNFANADITVTMGALGGNVVGNALVSQFVLPGTDQIFDVDITLDSTEIWDPTTGPDLNFYAVAAHEIGHAIGLRHVADTTELMNDFLAAEDLGDGDVAGAQFLYGRDPGDAPASTAQGTVTGIGTTGSVGGGDDGGSSGGGLIALLFGAVAALLGIFSGGSGAAVAMAAFANNKPEDDDDTLPEGGTVDDSYGDDLIAFLDLSQSDAGYPAGAEIMVRSHMHDHDHSHGHGPGDDHGFCFDPACSLCGDHLQAIDEDSAFADDMEEAAEEMAFIL